MLNTVHNCIFTARCYANRGTAVASCPSVCVWCKNDRWWPVLWFDCNAPTFWHVMLTIYVQCWLLIQCFAQITYTVLAGM